MSGRLARLGAVFVEPAVATALPGWTDVVPAPMRPATPLRPLAPTIVVLCAPGRERASAAAVGLAIARVFGSPCAIAAAVGVVAAPSCVGLRTPAAARVAAKLRARGERPSASGGLVWLVDRRAQALGGIVASDPAGAGAAASADLGRAVAATGVPGVLAMPLGRTDALDRVIAWHDGIVVMAEPDATTIVTERIAESLAVLGRPVVTASPLQRQAATLAELGLRAPFSAVHAVERLGLA